MKRAKFKYLFFGGIAGWLLGYIIGLAANNWYFFSPRNIIFYSAVGAFFGALMYNGIMMVDGYSNRFRYTVTGGLLGAALACIGGFIYVRSLDLSAISFQSGMVFEWALIHCGIIIGIIGFMIGSRADRRLSHSLN
jgi:fluoride ion exporter CrcB/FEX